MIPEKSARNSSNYNKMIYYATKEFCNNKHNRKLRISTKNDNEQNNSRSINSLFLINWNR